ILLDCGIYGGSIRNTLRPPGSGAPVSTRLASCIFRSRLAWVSRRRAELHVIRHRQLAAGDEVRHRAGREVNVLGDAVVALKSVTLITPDSQGFSPAIARTASVGSSPRPVDFVAMNDHRTLSGR